MAITKGRTSTSHATATLAVGDPAPELELQSHLGEPFKLSQLAGTNVVLAFFPFAFTAV